MSIFEFIEQYWRIILESILVILSFIVLLIKKKPVLNESDNILLAVYQNLPGIINGCEQLSTSDNKKATALLLVKAFVKKQFNVELSDSFLTLISRWIEDILTTPQKKEARI